jgi:hypothetical protein
MYCPSCGAWNPDESKFCGRCGRAVQATPATPSRLGGDVAQPKRSGLCLGILLACVLVALGAVAVGVYLLRDQLGIWPGAVVQPTAVVASPTASMTSAPVEATATPLPSPSPAVPATETPTPTLAQSPTPTATPTPAQRAFKAVYGGCIPHAQSLGSVKGRVLDKKGNAIPRAKVRIKIDGYDWQSDANPAATNADGWYEWILQVDQKVQFVELTVDGKSVSFSPRDLEVKATSSCFQRVDFVEQ